ncbi:aminotransferase class I/II-fold pyridoxal phosphate-dependent enzyme [Leucobacter sp. cx-328]|uniref:MalY/PatB family protein n=1 Tax=unclassified Leucobacter TaxID=2621730 RepID=UPI00165D47AF|nr:MULTISPECIES: aminotransferase class I/II-fold pyridoxal phosphate-dependent enzyme [unclassified Leucobacter]MBC9943697.1 aminotransferase class I/II-fold pyridoxal phosphate-dependent enzyme [Leucobacter sp. cx-328]
MSDCTDPSGVPFAALDPALLRNERTSLKWTRFPADILPMFVAEMDFTIAPEIKRALIERIENSDIGYLDSPGPLAPAFAGFARDRWGWDVNEDHVRLVTDVATGVVEALRVGRPAGGRLAIPVPTYPGFFEMLEELSFETVQVPLVVPGPGTDEAGGLDLEAIEREFAAGIDAFILCNPHNPHGIVFTHAELTALAELAAKYDVFVVSDEIHAPLVHDPAAFMPFAPVAAEAGTLALASTSASKGWNIAGAKCAVLVAADDRSAELLDKLPPEAVTRSSILGLHAGVAAFTEARDWLDRAIAQIKANDDLLAELVSAHLPRVVHTRPAASYVSWLDFREAGLGDDPYERILNDAKVAFNNGAFFGEGGQGHVRINLACAPETIREAIRRIAAILPSTPAADTHTTTVEGTVR